MEQALENKITELIALAKKSPYTTRVKSPHIVEDDSLSKAIRSEEDAKRFMKDLALAVEMAKAEKLK